MFIPLTILIIATYAFYHKLKGIDLTKPTKTAFILIKVINVLYMLQSLVRVPRILDRNHKKIYVKELLTYPIKSCKGLSLSSCGIDEFGLKYDRMYMFGIWDGNRYKSVTQRESPKLCLCTVELVEDQFKVSWPGSHAHEEVYLPSKIDDKLLQEITTQDESPVHLWEVEFRTYALNIEIPQLLMKFANLAPGTKLLYSDKGKFVKTNIPQPLRSWRSTRFQEYFPLLLMSQEDLDDVRSRFGDDDFPISFANFRPNIVVLGLEKPYDIDVWNKIEIGGHKWLIVSKCPRCTIPNINFETGEMDPKSRLSKCLMGYRRCDPGNSYMMFLGVHGIQMETGYDLKIGDQVEVFQKLINYYKPLE